jgi:tripartite-type tricarboxylate transporter receptor subunit TctC
MGMLGPKGLSPAIVNRLYQAITQSIQQPALKQSWASGVSGYIADGSTPIEFAKQLKDDVRRYSEIMKKINLQPS